MITKADEKKLRAVIGTRFSAEILKILAEKGITNKSGVAYSDRYVSHVLNGRYENQEIEKAFWELRNSKLEASRLIKSLKNKKPEAVTSGS
ncbi:hypothetical protein [Flavobacterium sp.]|uniref:hypothetical protein n=1 Tax=Flavobacterium sp. TaxID=239 RepID=UPI0011FF17E3|nr:hypothetical protein [Flavobacterium sp.]RZJ71105.1 MAG: hypothetical protein EOO49_11685 [Flavobacterium sp.]